MSIGILAHIPAPGVRITISQFHASNEGWLVSFVDCRWWTANPALSHCCRSNTAIGTGLGLGTGSQKKWIGMVKEDIPLRMNSFHLSKIRVLALSCCVSTILFW